VKTAKKREKVGQIVRLMKSGHCARHFVGRLSWRDQSSANNGNVSTSKRGLTEVKTD